jgi:ZIP family zinc transporter
VLLALGFALHHATEGFGIGAPRLALLGLIGGGPTFVGVLVAAGA